MRECVAEEWCHFFLREACNAAADAGDEEVELRVSGGKVDELLYVWRDGIHPAVHGGDGVALPLQAYTLPPDGAEVGVCCAGGATAMAPL